MYITDNIEIKLNNPNIEFTLGIHNEQGDAYEMREDGSVDYENPGIVHRFIIGFLIFSITIYY